MRTILVVAIAAIIGVQLAGEQPGGAANPCVDGRSRNPRLLPVDEAPSNREFFEYRARLQAVVERRDLEALVEAVDPGIRLGFDASGGVNAVRALFGPQAEAWEELRMVLARGGSFASPTSFAAPYVFAKWPEQLDSFACAAIVGRSVRVRQAPRLDATVIASVSYSIVRVIEDTDNRLWTRVQLGDGRTGYMWHAYVQRPIDYRALFNRIDGRWRMTAWVAGD